MRNRPGDYTTALAVSLFVPAGPPVHGGAPPACRL